MESKKKKAISVLSGGLDSTVATTVFKDYYIHALTFNYGQRSAEMEIKSARAVCKEIGADHTVIDLPWLAELGSSALTSDAEVPEPMLMNWMIRIFLQKQHAGYGFQDET